MEHYNDQDTEQFENEITLREQVFLYLKYWKWFVLSAGLALLAAFIYLRYSVPHYKSAATLLVKDEWRGGSISTESEAFADMGLFPKVKSNVDNEIEIIRSRTILERTVRELGLETTYIHEGVVKSAELYKSSPIQFLFSNVEENFKEYSYNYKVEVVSDKSFNLYTLSEKLIGSYNFGTTIKLKEGDLKVIQTANFKKFDSYAYTIIVHITPSSRLADGLKGRLGIKTLNDKVSIIELALVDPIGEKARDILNTLMEVYNQDVVDDKNRIFKNTSDFIDERLKIISEELEGVERKTEDYKKENQLADLVSQSGLFLQNASEFEKQEIETETQIRIARTMMDFVSKSNTYDLLPANILTADDNAAGLIDQYNQLILERNRMLKNAGPKNVVIQTINKKIDALKVNIKSSLERLLTSLTIKKNDLARQNALAAGRINKVPTMERNTRALGRQQQIKESLYLYLLQKREETAISLATTAPNAKVVDSAVKYDSPITPNRDIIYGGALLFGLLLPFSIIYVKNILDTKIKSRADIERKITVPFVGDVPKSFSNTEIIDSNSRSASAEAIRIVRTNLEFMLNQVPDGEAKTIFITSTLPKEGKTFIAVNLAGTIALSGKKVLLMGMDIRNPKLEDYMHLPKEGVTNYLSTPNANIENFVYKIPDFDQFYVLPSGVIPPNPAELLMNKRVGELFDKFKKEYDYIIVDTSPIHLVTDTLLIAQFAHAFVYVIRANYLDKQFLKVPHQLYQEKKLPNMAVLLNDTDINKGYGYGYGVYGYGYGYGPDKEKKSWIKQLLNKIKKEE
ncbi:polysaccharide biosynthesis tyrosine autokinase [Flavobacterium enshiense]|uniref:GumC family protein n=1 Tax=Flavobacterium enshiense TaxID=1341165 RepID=UPI00345C8F56